MPTPIGHALGGLATGWFSPYRKSRVAVAACVIAAVAPDLDILVHTHRMYTHSVGAVIVVGTLAWGVARLTPRRRSSRAWRPLSFSLTIAAAYGTHILLDWLGKDTAPPFGLMAMWPFSSRFYISGANVFMEISR